MNVVGEIIKDNLIWCTIKNNKFQREIIQKKMMTVERNGRIKIFHNRGLKSNIVIKETFLFKQRQI